MISGNYSTDPNKISQYDVLYPADIDSGKKFPFGKWILTTIALAPIVVFKTAVVSIDYLKFWWCFSFHQLDLVIHQGKANKLK